MADKHDVINTALKYIGVTENPPGSNECEFNRAYWGFNASGPDYPWCCAFLWFVFWKSGHGDLFYGGRKTALCAAFESWGRDNHMTVDKTKCEPGDVVTFDFNNKGRAHHIGLVFKNNGNGTIDVIEGNTSFSSNDNGGAVMIRTRNLTYVRYAIRPKYNEEVNGYMFRVHTISIGSLSNDVLLWQEILRARYGTEVGLDRSFGPITEKYTKKFQKDNGLDVDGCVGPLTWEKALALGD